MPVIRDAAARQKWINDIRLSGAHTVLGIGIANNCLGIVARTATGNAAGFPTAIACAAWVQAHGKMRSTTPPGGMAVFYGHYGQGEGHVALSSPTGFVWQNDGPDYNVINYVPRSWPVTNWGLPLLGWCDPIDIWGSALPTTPAVPAPPPVVVPQVPAPGTQTGLVMTSTSNGRLHLTWPVIANATMWDVVLAGPGVYKVGTVSVPAADLWGMRGSVTVAVVPRNGTGYGVGQALAVTV
jgi:hypothetical protein